MTLETILAIDMPYSAWSSTGSLTSEPDDTDMPRPSDQEAREKRLQDLAIVKSTQNKPASKNQDAA